MSQALVFGARYSVYVRIVRLALEEKKVPYDLIDIDIFAQDGPPGDYLERHPFGRIPAFEHDGFRLYETGAIIRYVEEVFPGIALLPDGPRNRARVDQVVSILDSYAYRIFVWDIFVERIHAPKAGREPDEERIAAALPKAETCLQALERLKADHIWLSGPELTLADLHAAPMFALFRLAKQGAELLARHPGLAAWWDLIAKRPGMAATRFPIEIGSTP